MEIYQIKNINNGQIFIGSSLNLKAKYNSYQFQTILGSHVNPQFQEDYNKAGGKDFIFEVIDYLESKEGLDYNYAKDLAVLEELCIEKLAPYYNTGSNK